MKLKLDTHWKAHTFSFSAALSRQTCATRLQRETSPIWGILALNRSYVGTVSTSGFKITPRFVQADIYLQGQFLPENEYTLVTYQSCINPMILLQFALALACLVCSFLIVLAENGAEYFLILASYVALELVLYPGLIFLALSSIGMVRFYLERENAEQAAAAALQELLSAGQRSSSRPATA